MPQDRHELRPLLLRSRAGDADARDRLLERVRPFLKALIRSWIGPALCGKLADSDIVQESLLRIAQHLDEFRGEEPGPSSSGCPASRNMEPIVESLEQAAEEWCVALLELEHQA